MTRKINFSKPVWVAVEEYKGSSLVSMCMNIITGKTVLWEHKPESKDMEPFYYGFIDMICANCNSIDSMLDVYIHSGTANPILSKNDFREFVVGRVAHTHNNVRRAYLILDEQTRHLFWLISQANGFQQHKIENEFQDIAF